MKKYIKDNRLVLISFSILVIWCLYCVIKWQSPTYKNDPILQYYNILDNGMRFIEIAAPLFVIIPGIFQFHRELHSGYIKNCLTRTSYRKYIVNLYLRSLINCLILPLFTILFMLFCCIKIRSLSFGSGGDMYIFYSSPEPEYAKIIYEFMIIYLFGIFLNSIFYINIGLFFCKKNANYLVCVVLSYISFIVLDIISEILIGGIFLARFLDIHNMQDSLNLFGIWDYIGVHNLLFCLFYYLALAVTSTVIIWFRYKDKEGVLIETEK